MADITTQAPQQPLRKAATSRNEPGKNGTRPEGEPARILLLCRSTGTGPRRGAQAVELALRQIAPEAIVHNVDVLKLEYAERQRRATAEGIKMQEQAPHNLARLFELADKPPGERNYTFSDRLRFWQRDFRRRFGNKKLLKSFEPFLLSEPWDVIVNVGATGGMIADLRGQGKISAPQFLLTTDFYTHRSLVTGYFSHYFIATEEGAEYLNLLGVKKKRISITGTPVQPVFSEPKDRDACLQAHGLQDDRPIILQMTGGLGMGPVEKVFQSILNVKKPVQLVTVCGNNSNLKKSLESLPVPDRHAVNVIGFTDKIDELLRVADVVVSKSGGMTSAEVLACGTAMIVIDPFPGLEAQNCDYLLENGVALKCMHIETLGFQLAQLLADPQRLAQMRDNALRLGKPQAAFDVARFILKWVEKKQGKQAEKA